MFEYSSFPFSQNDHSSASIGYEPITLGSLDAAPFIERNHSIPRFSSNYHTDFEDENTSMYPTQGYITKEPQKSISSWWLIAIVVLSLLGYWWWKEDIERFIARYF